MERVITDNTGEKITVTWDGERFALVLAKKVNGTKLVRAIITLNPKEMLDLITFAGNLGKEK